MQVVLHTKFVEVTGKPPCIMSGMTPTTSVNGLDLVAAGANGGFHCELAGGGRELPPKRRPWRWTDGRRQVVHREHRG